MPEVNGSYQRPQLRNAAINYRAGWFFVTAQVFENKSELGAIVGDECRLNPLGQKVKELIETLPRFNPEVYVDAFVVMPNHIHVILKITDRPSNSPHHLGKIMMKLKSLAAREYRLLKEKGAARDIGSHLWQANYWEKIVTSHDQLEAIRAYIKNNPKRWSTDRFGPVTTYHLGNLALLDEPFVAFVASQEGRTSELVIRELARGNALAPQEMSWGAGASSPAQNEKPIVISTFTSGQEREILRRLLAQGRRFIAVYPGGLPERLPAAISAALAEGRALLLSPVATGTGVNKQRAIWCNEYVIRRAKRVFGGFIKTGGSLAQLLGG